MSVGRSWTRSWSGTRAGVRRRERKVAPKPKGRCWPPSFGSLISELGAAIQDVLAESRPILARHVAGRARRPPKEPCLQRFALRPGLRLAGERPHVFAG